MHVSPCSCFSTFRGSMSCHCCRQPRAPSRRASMHETKSRGFCAIDPDLLTCSREQRLDANLTARFRGCRACINPSGATFLLTDDWAGLPERAYRPMAVAVASRPLEPGLPVPAEVLLRRVSEEVWLHADVSSHITNDRDLLNHGRSGRPAAVVRRGAISRPETSGWVLADRSDMLTL